jgi:hypothetical protein
MRVEKTIIERRDEERSLSIKNKRTKIHKYNKCPARRKLRWTRQKCMFEYITKIIYISL